MLYLGRNLRTKEKLQALEIVALVKAIKEDSYELTALIKHLRALRTIDRGLYNQKKRDLPYFCISQFRGNERLGANFKEVEHVVLDFDGLGPDELARAQKSFREDKRVLVAFISPSGEGLKALFSLDKPIYDAKAFHDLEMVFGSSFSKQHGLWEAFDQQTLDVTRATFICPDAEMHYNPKAESIAIEEYRHIWDTGLFSELEQGEETGETDEAGNPEEQAYAKIKALLNEKKPKVKAADLSEFWQNFMERFQAQLLPLDLAIAEAKEIKYGLQLRLRHISSAEAEVNIYFGKKGYSVVPSKKASTDATLNALVEKLVWLCIRENRYKLDQDGILRKV